MFKDLPEGQTHYENDGCGIREHNKKVKKSKIEITCLNIDCPERKGGKCNVLERIEKQEQEMSDNCDRFAEILVENTLIKILAEMESCGTAKECRHILKEYILKDK